MQKTLILFLLVTFNVQLFSQEYIELEKVPQTWKSTKETRLSASNKHYKQGDKSIAWQWKSGSTLSIYAPQGLDKAPATYKGGMILWIYNEDAKDANLRFEFKDEAEITQYHFDYHIDFTGWRACWIRFDEDMLGIKKNKDLKTLHIIAPADQDGGTLYFDRMLFPKRRINDRVTPDQQLPFINPTMNYNHWAALWHWEDTYKYELPRPSEFTHNDKKDINAIKNRITKDIEGKKLSNSLITKTRAEFDALQIQRKHGSIKGVPFVVKDEFVKGSNDRRFEHIDALIYNIAKGWYHNKAEGFDQMFIDLLDWSYDQGLCYGSGMGTNHHYGYQFRNVPKALWLMQKTLIETHKMAPALEMIQYWTGVAEIRQMPKVENFQGIVDTWNTIAISRLLAILMDTNDLTLKHNMQSYARWMGAMTEYSVGTIGGFKPDGAGFHHGMIYPAYMNGGYSSLGVILNYIGANSYSFPEASLLRMKKAFMLHSWYANKLSIPYALSGRHPIAESISTSSVNALGYLAKSFDPIDQELAAEYMRLSSSHAVLYHEFEQENITPAAAPEGNRSVNYGALNLHRRNNWLVSIKGFNNIVTGTEIYTKNNRYGRYQGYGGVQILANGNPISAEKSGYVLNGWDWNRVPGATTIHLPYDELNWYKPTSLNERSKTQEFAGAVSLEDNGIWGMILQEGDYENYTPNFKARKSVFSFGNRLVCLGSNINNSNTDNPTETTLFQSKLASEKEVITINDKNISKFPYSKTFKSNSTLIDNVGNAYYVVEGEVKVSKSKQESRENHKKTPTSGNFATAWINHGTAPTESAYEYVILVQSKKDELDLLKQTMQSHSTSPYTVFQKDKNAHILKNKSTNTTGYVLFESNDSLSSPHLIANSYPCLVMVKEGPNNNLKITMADPAINMAIPTKLTNTAIVQERLIRVTFRGSYSLKNSSKEYKIVSSNKDKTCVEYRCIHGLPLEIELTRK